MINGLRLRNRRSYGDLDLEFRLGTTFVVAPRRFLGVRPASSAWNDRRYFSSLLGLRQDSAVDDQLGPGDERGGVRE